MLMGPLHISMGHEIVYIACENVPHVCFDPPVLSTVLKHMPFICFRNLELIVSLLVHPSSSQEVPRIVLVCVSHWPKRKGRLQFHRGNTITCEPFVRYITEQVLAQTLHEGRRAKSMQQTSHRYRRRSSTTQAQSGHRHMQLV